MNIRLTLPFQLSCIAYSKETLEQYDIKLKVKLLDVKHSSVFFHQGKTIESLITEVTGLDRYSSQPVGVDTQNLVISDLDVQIYKFISDQPAKVVESRMSSGWREPSYWLLLDHYNKTLHLSIRSVTLLLNIHKNRL